MLLQDVVTEKSGAAFFDLRFGMQKMAGLPKLNSMESLNTKYVMQHPSTMCWRLTG